MTLEPRFMYLYVPYRDQSDLPVFDTAEPDLNWVELFRTNRYSGIDRIGDANQLAAGVTTRLFSKRPTRAASDAVGPRVLGLGRADLGCGAEGALLCVPVMMSGALVAFRVEEWWGAVGSWL